jgi:hypothetical protein
VVFILSDYGCESHHIFIDADRFGRIEYHGMTVFGLCQHFIAFSVVGAIVNGQLQF